LVVAMLVAFDQLALWAERRGWIYWRRRKSSGVRRRFSRRCRMAAYTAISFHVPSTPSRASVLEL